MATPSSSSTPAPAKAAISTPIASFQSVQQQLNAFQSIVNQAKAQGAKLQSIITNGTADKKLTAQQVQDMFGGTLPTLQQQLDKVAAL